ncbi:MAG TPA: UDP-N-acetylmuramoyl-L-alanine--D-glutamate ligase [Phycisphaerales bacterium]|nr:UDP-N-acetylmuramoyl-L-alanine--D-glutamate ligase [Phycisphaerales bacterium]
MDKAFFKDKRVVVMGLGRFGGGADSAAFAARSGARVLVTDLAGPDKLAEALEPMAGLSIEYRLGEHREHDFTAADVVIVNPAVPPDNPLIQVARQHRALITSQVELFFQMCPAPIVGVTGANGKSTTASLTAHLLAAAAGQRDVNYRNVYLSGNIGHRPLLGLLDELTEEDLVVLEISSFQLEQLARIQKGPYAAVITNLTPNHLDRHGTFETYCRVKETLFKYQPLNVQRPCLSVFNAEDTITGAWYTKYHDQPGRTCLAFSADDVPERLLTAFQCPGRANRSNLAAALAVASHFRIAPDRIAAAVTTFSPLDSRLQLVAEKNGVRWYDDSKATTPVSTLAALNGIDEPKILIAGGYDKGIDFSELGKCIAARVKAVVLIGQTAPKIEQAVRAAGPSKVVIRRAETMGRAVTICNELARSGDVVLLSPACASYDMFTNYIQRAQAFIDAVNAL